MKNNKIIFLKPNFIESERGLNKINNFFDFENKSKKLFKVVLASNDNEILSLDNSILLKNFYTNNKNLFFKKIKKASFNFPLKYELINPKTDLDISISPNQKVLKKYKIKSEGKDVFLYILDCESNSKIFLGHCFKNKTCLKNALNNQKILSYINKKRIKKGDFIYIPKGMPYNISQGILAFKIEFGNDLEYKINSFSNEIIDEKERMLSFESINIPCHKKPYFKQIKNLNNSFLSTFIKSKKINIYFLNCREDELKIENQSFILATVLTGEGFIDGVKIKKGDTFIITNLLNKFYLKGNISLIISHL